MKAEMPEALRSKHGKELEIRWTERLGFGSECLKPMIRRLLTEENFCFPILSQAQSDRRDNSSERQ